MLLAPTPLLILITLGTRTECYQMQAEMEKVAEGQIS